MNLMHTFINSPWQLGGLTLPHRLIQGPLAGTSCAPFRVLFNQFTPPAYCVSEMISAKDVLHRHSTTSRYLYRASEEPLLAYQISGHEPQVLANAAIYLQELGADLIDLNCGCPKQKIRRKGAGSALLETPELLVDIVQALRSKIQIPLTVKIRLQGTPQDLILTQHIAEAGADALIIHGRRWTDDYDVACDWEQIARIKQQAHIPVIANGDICHRADLEHLVTETGCDAYMISRGGSGRPWLYQELLEQRQVAVDSNQLVTLFMSHLTALAALEDEYKAVLQSKSLVRYYFNHVINQDQLRQFYQLSSLDTIYQFLGAAIVSSSCLLS
jgi:nifR3 family TIM-barrel protein